MRRLPIRSSQSASKFGRSFLRLRVGSVGSCGICRSTSSTTIRLSFADNAASCSAAAAEYSMMYFTSGETRACASHCKPLTAHLRLVRADILCASARDNVAEEIGGGGDVAIPGDWQIQRGVDRGGAGKKLVLREVLK